MSGPKREVPKGSRRRAARDENRRWVWLSETQVFMGWFIILGVAALLGLLYLSQASRVARSGRYMQELQTELEEIKKHNSDLERDIARAESLDRLQAGARRLGFVRAEPGDVEYIIVNDYPAGKPAPQPTPVPMSEPIETIEEALWVAVSSRVGSLQRGEAREP